MGCRRRPWKETLCLTFAIAEESQPEYMSDPGDAKRRTLTHLQEGHADIVRLLCDGGADKDKAMQDGADAFLLRLTHLDAFLLKGPGPPPSRVPSRSRSRPSERMSAGPRLHPDHGGLR